MVVDKWCLGIESTAHTFGVGIVDFSGNVRSVVNDTYVPDTGGLHPLKTSEHHLDCFQRVIEDAVARAGVRLRDASLVAFSQGPGLGPCLRTGATVARSLHAFLGVPLVGVNHCVAHLEIGRLACAIDDPLAVYVSGGNTIVSAFDAGRYQVFGETLDIALGNMLDTFARGAGLAHPGGPKIEALAADPAGEFIELPYTVKGMDLAFSGLLTAASRALQHHVLASVARSLQETAFAMLAEVSERALAHAGKASVLLTGGVAVNTRLQAMIRAVAEEHGATFHVVPRHLAGDNGAMIAWTGILQHLHGTSTSLAGSNVIPRWRLDGVPVPWRGGDGAGCDRQLTVPRWRGERVAGGISPVMEHGLLVAKGAEAVLVKHPWFDLPEALYKIRVEKPYRHPVIDARLRRERTTLEARILGALVDSNLPVPGVRDVNLRDCFVVMDFLPGTRLRDAIGNQALVSSGTFHRIGMIVAAMHHAGVVHGDLTTSNIMIDAGSGALHLVDFGLASFNPGIEEKAVDLHSFKRVLMSTHATFFKDLHSPFIEGYRSGASNAGWTRVADAILKRVEQIETRGRYIGKAQRG